MEEAARIKTGRSCCSMMFDDGVALAAVADYCCQQGGTKVVMAVMVERLHLRKVTQA